LQIYYQLYGRYSIALMEIAQSLGSQSNAE
jgi:hypothetical protein